MGRAESRAKLLAVARAQVVASGSGDVSLRQVAREAGFAPSSVYEHFHGRSGLLDAVAREVAEDLRRDLESAVRIEGSCCDRLLAQAMAYVTFAATRPGEFHLCFTKRQLPAGIQAPPSYSPLWPVIAELNRGLASGELVAPSGFGALELAIALWTQVHGIATLRQMYFAEVDDFEPRARQIVEATLAGWRRS